MTHLQSRKTALITGATSGIGFHCADLLALKGYDVVIIGRNEAKMNKAKALLEKHPVQVHALLLDLTQADSAQTIYDFCQQKQLHIDVLICNAGMYMVQCLADTPPKEIEKVVNLHVLNPSLLCHYFGKHMKEKREGHILIVSSLAAYTPFPTLSLYAGSKRYLSHLSHAIRSELKPYNVGVTNLCPGGVSTDFFPTIGSVIRLATRFHFMMTPQKVAQKALKAMFKNKKKITPGFYNRILIALIPLLPQCIIDYLHTHTSFFSNQMDYEL